uniref:Uncharacterized protein n=1 Tax=Heliothis virescens TaxID=7102 RepID=A0A2A4JCX6_HELVI
MSHSETHQVSCTQEMMWQTVLSHHYSTEPAELRKLKEQLANVNCKCRGCNYTNNSKPSCQRLKDTKDIEVQADRYAIDARSNITDNFFTNSICPSCCMTLNMLQKVKVLKDEVSETIASMFSTDKSTGRENWLQEKTTSIADPVISKPLSEDLNSTCDQGDNTSDITVRHVGSLTNHRKRHSERVTFLDSEYQRNVEVTKKTPSTSCVCLQDFIDSIRPPLGLMSRYG